MNNLSWLLYLAGIAENIQALLLVSGIFGLLTCIGFAFFCWTDDSDNPVPKSYSFLCAAAILLGVMMPSKATLYAIILSEGGEEIMKSETGTKAVDALNRYLDSVGLEEKED